MSTDLKTDYEGLQMIEITWELYPNQTVEVESCRVLVGTIKKGYLWEQELTRELIEELRPFCDKYYGDKNHIERLEELLIAINK